MGPVGNQGFQGGGVGRSPILSKSSKKSVKKSQESAKSGKNRKNLIFFY